jgi:hypothetical protein
MKEKLLLAFNKMIDKSYVSFTEDAINDLKEMGRESSAKDLGENNLLMIDSINSNGLLNLTSMNGNCFDEISIDYLDLTTKIDYKIKKGDRFLCLKDYIMDDGSTSYKKDKIYLSESNDHITDNNFDVNHKMDEQDDFFEYFKLVV